MNSGIKTNHPTGQDLDEVIKEWWETLDAAVGDFGNMPAPKEGKPSIKGNYVFLYGHYEGTGPAASTHYGYLEKRYLDRTIVFPLVNGKYGKGESYIGKDISELARSFGDVNIGVLQSKYSDDLYANVKHDSELIDIPQIDWVSHELPKSHELESSVMNDGYYFGTWVFIEPGQLSEGDVITFGGKGGPSVGSPKLKDKSLMNADFVTYRYDALERFITKAIWTIQDPPRDPPE
jgi:hypothetical protein